MNSGDIPNKDPLTEPAIPDDFESGAIKGCQKPEQEVLPPISETLFPQSEITKTFSDLASNPSTYSKKEPLHIAAASMRENDKRLENSRLRIEAQEKTIETLRSNLETLRVNSGKQTSEIKALRAMRWITSIVYVLAAFSMSVGWNEHEKDGSLSLLFLGIALLIVGFVSPLFLNNVGDEE